MAFNLSAPFGQSSQPAFGQASQQPQQPNTANPFGAPSSSGSPPGGKITFGARAAAAQQPAASNTPPAQPGILFGSSVGDGQNSLNFAGTGGFFGGGTSSQSAQVNASGTTPPFGGSAPGSGFSGSGFGTFGQGQQAGQGFGGFGAPAAAVSSSSAAPSPSNAFARLGARVTPAPAADKQSDANSFGTPPFGRPALAGAGNSATQPSTQIGGLLGNQQAGNAFGFGSGPALGVNPFAVPTFGATVQPREFGRAAKKNQLQQQQQTGADQQQAQTDKHLNSEQQLKRPKSPALLPKQLPTQQQQVNASSQPPVPSSELADPAALAARSHRFGPARPKSGGGSSWRAFAAAGPTDADADTTDDQQGAVCLLECKADRSSISGALQTRAAPLMMAIGSAYHVDSLADALQRSPR